MSRKDLYNRASTLPAKAASEAPVPDEQAIATSPIEAVPANIPANTKKQSGSVKPACRLDGIEVLSRVLRTVLACRVGEFADYAECLYDYDDEYNCHVFKLGVKKHLKGQKRMSSAMRSVIRSTTHEKIETFLEELDLVSHADKSNIFPEYGEIYIDSKMEMLEMLNRYLDRAAIDIIDIHSIELPPASLPEEFAEAGSPDFNPNQYFREVITTIGSCVEDDMKYDKTLGDDLLRNAFYMPYTSINAYRTYAASVEQDIPTLKVGLGMLFAIAEQVIKFEDNLDDTRNANLDLEFKPLRLSIN